MEETGQKSGEEPILQNNIDKGYGNSNMQKEMIGIKFNGRKQIFRMTEEKLKSYRQNTRDILRKKRVHMNKNKKQWENCATPT